MRALLTFIGILLTTFIHSQKLDVEGDIKVGSSGTPTPDPGTIRWTGTDFLGWNGTKWISLTSGVAYEGEVTDVDGNKYQTIKIGTQEWMAVNLRTSKYREGTAIPQVTDNTAWQNANYGAWSWYSNNNIYDQPYGKLYNWHAVNDGRGLCPTGWHGPSDAEWTTLTTFLGGESVAGGPMKEMGTAHWISPNAGATNASGFSGLPGGNRSTFGPFNNLGNNGFWWSSSESGANAWFRSLSYNNVNVSRNGVDKRLGFSVRCVRD
jgi:uncharacterized protein (TIGR02145 family)